jgi:hypothetical protein
MPLVELILAERAPLVLLRLSLPLANVRSRSNICRHHSRPSSWFDVLSMSCSLQTSTEPFGSAGGNFFQFKALM